MSDKPMNFLDSFGEIRRRAFKELVKRGVDRDLADQITRDMLAVRQGYQNPFERKFQQKYKEQPALLKALKRMVEPDQREKLYNEAVSMLESQGDITTPDASRDTATKDIPSKSDSNKKYPTPPDEIRAPFTSAVDAKSVGKMLKDARTTVGVTQAAIGEALQKSEGAIRSLENSKMTPSLPKIQEYADVIGYDVEVRLIPRDVS